MVKKIGGKGNRIGAWAFLIGVILAAIIGLFWQYIGGASSAILSLLVILGIVVGLLNVGSKEVSAFLLASVALVIVSYIGTNIEIMGENVLEIIPLIGSILNALLVLFIPATIIVALKSVFAISRD